MPDVLSRDSHTRYGKHSILSTGLHNTSRAQYGLDTLAAEYRVYHEALRPLCLITAHEPELRYFNTILQALFEQEYALAPRMVHQTVLFLFKTPLTHTIGF